MSGERRKKFNAIFFAAIMVISMVAMGVGGLAGSAAADASNIEFGSTGTADVVDLNTQDTTLEITVTHADTDDNVGIAFAPTSESANYDSTGAGHYYEEQATADGTETTFSIDVSSVADNAGNNGLNADNYDIAAEAGTVSEPADNNDITDGGDWGQTFSSFEVTDEITDVDLTLDDTGLVVGDSTGVSDVVATYGDGTTEERSGELNEEDFTSSDTGVLSVQAATPPTFDAEAVGTSDVSVDGNALDGDSPQSNLVEVTVGPTNIGDTDAQVVPNPDTLFENSIETIEVEVDDHPGGEAAYRVEAPDESVIVSGQTDEEGSFSFTADPSGDGLEAGDSYDVIVNYDDFDEFDGEINADVDVVPEVDLDLQLDPVEPVFADDVAFTGTFTGEEGDRPDNFEFLKLNYTDSNGDATNVELTDLRVLSDGTIETRGGTAQVQDAGEYTVVYNDTNQEFELETFEVGNVEGDLQLEADDPVAGNEESEAYNITVTDQNDEPLVLSETAANVDDTEGSFEDTEGFVAVSGNFSADGDFTIEGEDASDGATELLRVVDEQGNVEETINALDGDTIVEFHVETTDSGELNFTAEAEDANSEITTNLAVRTDDDGDRGADNFDDADEVAENVAVGGVEDAFFFSPSTLDITADADSVEVGAGEDINLDVEVTSSEEELTVAEAGEISISVQDSNFDEAGDGSILDIANITVSGDTLVGEDRVTDIPTDEDNTPITESNLFFEQTGELTVDVVAENTSSGDTFEASETLDVAGDVLLDLSPTEVEADNEEDVLVQVEDGETGDVTFDRTVTLDHSNEDGFGDSEDQIILDSDDFSTSANAFVRENVSFELPGSIDLTVDDGNGDTINVTDAIAVEGEDRYALDTDEQLLAGSTDDLNITVTDLEEDRVLNETDEDELNDLADTLVIGDGEDPFFNSDDAGTEVNVDAENGTLTAVDVLPDVDESTVNMSASTDGGAFSAEGDVNVVEPEITTSLGDDVLTAGLTSDDFEITAEDPRTGDGLADAELRFDTTNTSVELTNVSDGTDFESEDALDENGSVTVNATTDAITGSPANVTFDVKADGTEFFGATDLDVESQQLAEREDGQDVELRDEIEFDSEENIRFILRDANDARLDERDVNVTGAGVDFQGVTDEGFFSIDFAEEELEEGETIIFNASNDASGVDELTLATVDVTEDLEEVELSASVENDTVTQGEDFVFSVTRSDFNEQTSTDIAFLNETGDAVYETSTGDVDTDGYGVVDSSELDAGDYEVEFTKESTSSKSFQADSLNVTVEEPNVPRVSIEDQETTGDSVEVASALNPDDDYVVVIHAEGENETVGDVVGFSDTIEAGDEVTDLTIALDPALEENQTVTAMLHFADEEDDYGAPIEFEGEVVQDQASVTITDEPAEHESGVSQELFDAVDQDGSGELTLGELRDAVASWNDDGQVGGVDATLGDLRLLVQWWN